eukprot:364503-Chlamydomonas_euryale.AAC.9
MSAVRHAAALFNTAAECPKQAAVSSCLTQQQSAPSSTTQMFNMAVQCSKQYNTAVQHFSRVLKARRCACGAAWHAVCWPHPRQAREHTWQLGPPCCWPAAQCPCAAAPSPHEALHVAPAAKHQHDEQSNGIHKHRASFHDVDGQPGRACTEPPGRACTKPPGGASFDPPGGASTDPPGRTCMDYPRQDMCQPYRRDMCQPYRQDMCQPYRQDMCQPYRQDMCCQVSMDSLGVWLTARRCLAAALSARHPAALQLADRGPAAHPANICTHGSMQTFACIRINSKRATTNSLVRDCNYAPWLRKGHHSTR